MKIYYFSNDTNDACIGNIPNSEWESDEVDYYGVDVAFPVGSDVYVYQSDPRYDGQTQGMLCNGICLYIYIYINC